MISGCQLKGRRKRRQAVERRGKKEGKKEKNGPL